MSKKRVSARRWRRAFRFHEMELKKYRGWHGRWTWEAHDALSWEEYVAKLRAEGRDSPDVGECPF